MIRQGVARVGECRAQAGGGFDAPSNPTHNSQKLNPPSWVVKENICRTRPRLPYCRTHQLPDWPGMVHGTILPLNHFQRFEGHFHSPRFKRPLAGISCPWKIRLTTIVYSSAPPGGMIMTQSMILASWLFDGISGNS